MKKFFAGIALLGTFAFASAQTISFENTTYNYGTIKPGAEGTRFFTVKNTGDKPLIISNVKASCGCTTPEFSQDPIMPGKTAKIKVGYNTALVGAFDKSIEVMSNDPMNGRMQIFIKGNVDPNAPEPKPLAAAELKAKAKADKKAVRVAKKTTKTVVTR